MGIQTDTPQLDAIIDESIRLELNTSTLYFTFYEHFSDDADFWWKLAEEEGNHAALIRSGRDYFKPAGRFPQKLVSDSLDALLAVNKQLRKLLSEIRQHKPERHAAFNTAYVLELSAGELHFQKFMEPTMDTTDMEKIFIRLNRDDQLHAERILKYMNTHNIPVDSALSLVSPVPAGAVNFHPKRSGHEPRRFSRTDENH